MAVRSVNSNNETNGRSCNNRSNRSNVSPSYGSKSSSKTSSKSSSKSNSNENKEASNMCELIKEVRKLTMKQKKTGEKKKGVKELEMFRRKYRKNALSILKKSNINTTLTPIEKFENVLTQQPKLKLFTFRRLLSCQTITQRDVENPNVIELAKKQYNIIAQAQKKRQKEAKQKRT